MESGNVITIVVVLVTAALAVGGYISAIAALKQEVKSLKVSIKGLGERQGESERAVAVIEERIANIHRENHVGRQLGKLVQRLSPQAAPTRRKTGAIPAHVEEDESSGEHDDQ